MLAFQRSGGFQASSPDSANRLWSTMRRRTNHFFGRTSEVVQRVCQIGLGGDSSQATSVLHGRIEPAGARGFERGPKRLSGPHSVPDRTRGRTVGETALAMRTFVRISSVRTNVRDWRIS
jgi:hypothetical protein